MIPSKMRFEDLNTIVNLKQKAFQSKRQQAFIGDLKNSYLESTDSGKSPNDVLLIRQSQWVFIRQRKGTIASIQERLSNWCRKANVVMLILNIFFFNFQSDDSHQFGNYNICFLAIFANSSLRHRLLQAQSRVYFALFQYFILLLLLFLFFRRGNP